MNTASASVTEGQARWSLRLFGGFELSVRPGGERATPAGKRERVLLAYLALNPKGREQRRKLTTLLWGDAADETTLENLRNCLYGLRKTLGDSEHRVIASDGEDIVLDASAFEVDALAFRRLAASSDVGDLDLAANLYTGGLLDGLDIESEEFESWRRTEATRCRNQAIDVLTRLMTQLDEAGETERAIQTGERILRLEPLHEPAVRVLMRLYGGSGRRSAAIQLYRTLGDALKADLGAQPEAETRAVFADITRGGEEQPLAPSLPATTIPASPQSLSWPAPGSAPPGPREARPKDRLRARPEGKLAGHPGDEGLMRRVDTPSQNATADMHAPAWLAVIRSRWILAGGLAAALATFLFYQFTTPPGTTTAQRTGVEAAGEAPAGAVSIAVLPFVNISGDAAQEFFSDGMTEEITTALAKIKDLRVVGRTSAYQFKDERKDLRAIGQALEATHLLEGSVRKEENRLRITAQLIEVDSGVHVWTESYDRELTGVFAIQEEIALAIAGALRVPLGLAPGENLVSSRAIAPESYEQYLRARTLVRNRSQIGQGTWYDAAITMLEQVVAREPTYAPAWGLLAMLSGDEDGAKKKEMAAREAIRLDPRSATGYAALAQIQREHGNFAAGEDLYRKALALDPNEPEVLDGFSNRLAAVGRIKEALSIREKLRTLEPFVPTYNYITAAIMLIDGQGTAAIPILEALPAAAARNRVLAHAYASQGRYGEAADTLLAIKGENQRFGPVEEAARLIRSAPTKVKAPEALPAFDNALSFVYLYVGAPDRVLDYQERWMAEGKYLISQQVRYLWSPDFAPVRKTERFKALMRAAGYVDYWRARGWPDHCRPQGADDFVCT